MRAFSNLCACICLCIFKSVRMPKSVRMLKSVHMRPFVYASVCFSHEQVVILVLAEGRSLSEQRTAGRYLIPMGIHAFYLSSYLVRQIKFAVAGVF